jgi:hypothetical protein
MNARSTRRGIAAILALLLAVSIAPMTASAATGRITGTVTMFGCQPGSDLRVIAYDITGLTGEGEPPREVPAIVSQGREPNAFNFEFNGLQLGRAFEVDGVIPEETCGHVAWDSDAGRIALPDASAPLVFRGYAIRSRLEIRNERSDDPDIEWLGADFAETDAGSMHRVLRWSTSHSTTRGILQLATEQFPLVDPCIEPPGLIHSETVSAGGGEWSEVTVDLGSVLDQVPAQHKRFVLGGAGVFARVLPVVQEGSVKNCNLIDTGAAGHAIISFKIRKAPKPAPQIKLPDKGPVLPALQYGDQGQPLAYGPPLFDRSNPGGNERPHGAQLCYQATKWHKVNLKFPAPLGDSYAGAAGLPDGHWIFPGDVFCHIYVKNSPKSSSFLDDFSDFVSGAIEGVAWFVNKISDMYSSIKTFVVKRVVDALDWVGNNVVGYDFCQSACETLVVAAVDYGMAAMGLPPSLPNFDQLTSMGVDYLATQIAEQTGVPPEVVDHAYDIAVQSVKKMKETRGGAGPAPALFDWAVNYTGFTPAALVLKLRHFNVAGAKKSPAVLWIDPSDQIFQWTTIPLPKDMPEIVSSGIPFYEPFLTVPISLTPDATVVDDFFCPKGKCTPPWRNFMFNVEYRLAVEAQHCSSHGGTRFDVRGADLVDQNLIVFHEAQWTVEPNAINTSFFFGPVYDRCLMGG